MLYCHHGSSFSSKGVGLFKNRVLIVAILISFIVSVGAVYIPAMNKLFGTTPLRPVEFLTVLAISSVGFVYLEISKHVRSKRMGFEAGSRR
jgi:Ca2+-transporting ATPase